MNDKKEKANAIFQMGRTYGSLGKTSEANTYFKESAKLFEEAGLKRDAAIALLSAGKSSQSQIEAINNFKNAQALTKTIGDTKLEISALIETGNGFYGLGDFSQALETYEQALKTSREMNYQDKIASILDNMGSA